SVDARVEEEIHATLRRILEGRTTLLIAHRRSTLRLADRIAVVDGGRVADIGTHDELLERSILYRRLLSGPGDDCESVDDGSAEPILTGVTASAWTPVTNGDGNGSQAVATTALNTTAQARIGGGGGGGGGWAGGGGMVGNFLAPTPELMAKVAK